MSYSIWLEFDEASTSALQDEILNLSSEFGGPKFAPHMTLIGDLGLPIEPVIYLAERFAKCWPSEKLIVEDVFSAQKYFMALYLSVKIPESMVKMRNALFLEVGPINASQDEPHVSLAYGNHPSGANLQVISRLKNKFVGNSFNVRYINVVRSSKSTPINEWETVNRLEVV